MKVDKQPFDQYIELLNQYFKYVRLKYILDQKTQGPVIQVVYSLNASLNPAEKIGLVPRSEPQADYFVYATIDGRTLPLESGIVADLADKTKSEEPPENALRPELYKSGIASYFGKPLEVIAIEILGNEPLISSKWDILTLKVISEKEGYLNMASLMPLLK